MLQNEVSIPYYIRSRLVLIHPLSITFGHSSSLPSHLPHHYLPPINRAFQTNCEGVRVEKEKKIRPVRLKWLSGHLEFHTPAAIQFSNSPLILAAVMIAKAPLPDFDHDIPLCFWRVATTGISHSL